MNSTTKNIILIIILVVLAISVHLIFKKVVIEDKGNVFSETGNLMKDNPGLKDNIWYLSFEKQGEPGLSTELVFDEDSMCSLTSEAESLCDLSKLATGMRVKIEGEEKNNIVSVRTLAVLERPADETMSVKLYYYDPSKDQGPGGVQCTRAGLVSVDRAIPKTTMPLTESITLLLRGEISVEEKAKGVTSEFPLPGVSLASATVSESGVATLTFNDPNSKTGGGSCRIAILWAQIEATAKQFPTVTSVRFMPEELFQP